MRQMGTHRSRVLGAFLRRACHVVDHIALLQVKVNDHRLGMVPFQVRIDALAAEKKNLIVFLVAQVAAEAAACYLSCAQAARAAALVEIEVIAEIG